MQLGVASAGCHPPIYVLCAWCACAFAPEIGAQSFSVKTFLTIGLSEPWHVTWLAIWITGSLSA